tara:strand:+ start:4427 stop:4639 length:213 start_codon:yes stop_codon:yes gene_type:complete
MNTSIRYLDQLKTRKEIQFTYFNSPIKVVVKDEEDAIGYLERFLEKEEKRIKSFREELNKFKASYRGCEI